MDKTITLRELIAALRANNVDDAERVAKWLFFTTELSRDPFDIKFTG